MKTLVYTLLCLISVSARAADSYTSDDLAIKIPVMVVNTVNNCYLKNFTVEANYKDSIVKTDSAKLSLNVSSDTHRLFGPAIYTPATYFSSTGDSNAVYSYGYNQLGHNTGNVDNSSPMFLSNLTNIKKMAVNPSYDELRTNPAGIGFSGANGDGAQLVFNPSLKDNSNPIDKLPDYTWYVSVELICPSSKSGSSLVTHTYKDSLEMSSLYEEPYKSDRYFTNPWKMSPSYSSYQYQPVVFIISTLADKDSSSNVIAITSRPLSYFMQKSCSVISPKDMAKNSSLKCHVNLFSSKSFNDIKNEGNFSPYSLMIQLDH